MKANMRYVGSLILVLALIIGCAASEECKIPDAKAGLAQIPEYREYSPSHYTVITYKSYFPRIQWVGLYWEGPISGALMAYNCDGEFLSAVETGGIESLKFFYGPRNIQPTVAIQEISTGTGYYRVGYVIYSIQENRIRKVWEHTKYESVFVFPWEDGHVDSFEIKPVGPPPGDFGIKLEVEGVRKVYPVSEEWSDFRVEKLPTKYYCWTASAGTYVECNKK